VGVARKIKPKLKGPYVINKVLKYDRYLILDFNDPAALIKVSGVAKILSIGLENENKVVNISKNL